MPLACGAFPVADATAGVKTLTKTHRLRWDKNRASFQIARAQR